MKMRLVVIAMLGMSVYAAAQFGGGRSRQFGGGGRFNGEDGGQTGGRCLVPGYFGSGEEDSTTPRKIDRSGFVYARIKYHPTPNWREVREVPWHHDYPDGDTMFPASLQRLTTVFTNPDSYQLVDIDSKELFEYPFTYMSEPGYLNLLPGDIKNLREYLDRGGFLLMDDFRGNEYDNSQWQNMALQMKKLFPDRELQPVPPTHAIFSGFYDIDPHDSRANTNSGAAGSDQSEIAGWASTIKAIKTIKNRLTLTTTLTSVRQCVNRVIHTHFDGRSGLMD